jgi:hypothetical protein
MRLYALLLGLALALAACDEIVGIQTHQLAGDGDVDGGATSGGDAGPGSAGDSGPGNDDG